MPAIVGGVAGNDHFMTLARANVVITAGASVRLHRVIRLHVPDIDLIVVFGPAVH